MTAGLSSQPNQCRSEPAKTTTRDHGGQGEQVRRHPVPREERAEREHEADRQDKQGEQDEARGAVVACQHAEQRARGEENREAAEVGEEGRA